MMRIYIALAVVAIVSAVSFAGYKYVTNMQNTIITLTANNQLLTNTVETQQETIKRSQLAARQSQETARVLTVNLQEAEQGLDELKQKLTNHDLTKLTIAKPGLIENRINNATQELFDRLRSDTGAN